MPSFDTVCEANFVEVKNAVENTAKEIGTRFDFKGTSAGVELKDKEITLFGDAEFQLQQVEDILRGKLSKEIAFALSISPKTVEVHRHSIMSKMEAKSVAELACLALAAAPKLLTEHDES